MKTQGYRGQEKWGWTSRQQGQENQSSLGPRQGHPGPLLSGNEQDGSFVPGHENCLDIFLISWKELSPLSTYSPAGCGMMTITLTELDEGDEGQTAVVRCLLLFLTLAGCESALRQILVEGRPRKVPQLTPGAKKGPVFIYHLLLEVT